MKAYLDTVETPAGPLSFAVNEEGGLIRTHFEESDDPADIEDALQVEGYDVFVQDGNHTAQLREEISEYCAGGRSEFTVPLAASGTVWQKEVWEALRSIPFGETRSYSQVADMVGRPGAARAVGGANGCNRLPLVVPCHRVISADGSLGGFNGGLHLKKKLLEHERQVMGQSPPADGR